MRSWILMAALISCGCGDSATGPGSSEGSEADAGGNAYVPPFSNCSGGAPAEEPPAEATCLGEEGAPADTPPLLVVENEIVTYEGVEAVHITLTFSPLFVDNTYGATAVGWDKHTFKDLVGSDHAQLAVYDATGEMLFDLKIDYISEDADAPCGYASKGVEKVDLGDPAAILGATTSLDRNLNERGYCEYTTDSPASDADCTPNPAAPDWDFRVVYEVWIALSAFDPNGFGSASMESVHASPAKGGENTITVVPQECGCVEIDPGDCDYTPPEQCDPACPTGEFCESGTCMPNECDPACPTGEFCEGGTCIPTVE